MLISSDITAASNSGLRPGAIAAIKTLATVRAVTLATTGYTEYPVAPLGTENILLSYTFPPNTVTPGTQVRVRLYGQTEAVAGGFSPTVWVAQPIGTAVTLLSYGASGAAETWILDAAFSFSAFGDATTPFTSRSQNRTGSSQAMEVRGFVDLRTGLPGGIIDERMNVVPPPPPAPPMVVVNQPIQVYVSLMSDIAFNVQGGWMEAL
jgi:hypothetical protein